MRPFRPHEYPLDRCVTGPYEVGDENGKKTLIYRCELCNTESGSPRLCEGCWVCDSRVRWR